MNDKRLIGLAVTTLVVCALVWAWQIRKEKDVSTTPVKGELEATYTALLKEVKRHFETAAAELNRDAARYGNDGVTLVMAEVGEGPSMVYYYRVDLTRHEDFTEERVRKELVQRCCMTPEMRDYMPYGVSYLFHYMDVDDVPMFSLRINEAACQTLEQHLPQPQ